MKISIQWSALRSVLRSAVRPIVWTTRRSIRRFARRSTRRSFPGSGRRFGPRSLAELALLLVAGLPCVVAGAGAELTATEQAWLQGIWPVLAFAEQAGLPIDVVVQPQPSPGAAPLALAFIGGRCKMVLSMRGNAEAQATLERIRPELKAATLELMAAHELGHCRRYVDGAWYHLPAGFGAGPGEAPERLATDLSAAHAAMKATRREEGYADLVGLAWTQQRHPQHYARLHAWLLQERSRDLIEGSHHDTLAWVRLAVQGESLGTGSLFVGPARLWAEGLQAAD